VEARLNTLWRSWSDESRLARAFLSGASSTPQRLLLVILGAALEVAVRDGTLWAWGLTSNGQSAVPTRVGRDTDWTRISAGGEFDLAIKKDGSAWAWGRNFCGQLGLGDRHNRMVPTRIVRLK
jgi:alpha-tubulin suppressor-like RCC1 family protein